METPIDDPEIPLLEVPVRARFAFALVVPEDHESARAHDLEHLLDDESRICRMVERVPRIDEVEARGAEFRP